MTRYRTIVVDPPWDHSDGTGKHLGTKDRRPERRRCTLPPHITPLPYGAMSSTDIALLPVDDLATADAHLYLWTTNRYLRNAYDIAEVWGFFPVKPLIWCKEPMGFFGGAFVSSAEFVLFARRGTLRHTGTAGRQWWQWRRSAHSAKPEAFLDLVETVSPGPYLELFARRQRLGWDTWGDQALEHVTMQAPSERRANPETELLRRASPH